MVQGLINCNFASENKNKLVIQGINNIINNKRLSDMNDEKTIYDDEKTQYQSQDEEATQYDEAYERENDKSEETTSSEDKKPENGKKQSMWKKVAVGAGTGILLGAGATILSASAPIDHTEGDEGEGEQHPEWTDGEVPVATSVSDEMSFSEAFAAARTEVGSGGVFEWHGNIYSTFTEEEWNGMTAEQRDEYGSHFSWHSDASHDTASASHSSHSPHSTTATEDVEVVATNDNQEQTNQSHEANNSEVEVADVTPAGNNGTAEEVAVVDAEPEVEVLGVIHDDESGANIGGLVVDGQEVVLIDVDGDTTFDVMGSDVNGDQQLSQNELVDISGQNITVNDLGGISNPDGSMYASNDNEIDYTNDAAVYES